MLDHFSVPGFDSRAGPPMSDFVGAHAVANALIAIANSYATQSNNETVVNAATTRPGTERMVFELEFLANPGDTLIELAKDLEAQPGVPLISVLMYDGHDDGISVLIRDGLSAKEWASVKEEMTRIIKANI